MTPLAEKIRHRLNYTYEALDREKLTRWLMARSSNVDLLIVDCHGKPIGVGLGCTFDGSVRLVFWKFIEPCLVNAIQEICDLLDQSLQSYTAVQRETTLNSAETQLKGFAGRIYSRMVDLDRSMRGNGYPESVTPYDPRRELSSAHELVSHKLAILRTHFLPAGDTGLWGKAKSFWHKYWQWIISAVLIPLIIACAKALSG